MNNETVKQGLNEIFNIFWAKYRDNPPAKYDTTGWDNIQQQGHDLMEKYPSLKGAVGDVIVLLDQRMRERSNGK